MKDIGRWIYKSMNILRMKDVATYIPFMFVRKCLK